MKESRKKLVLHIVLVLLIVSLICLSYYLKSVFDYKEKVSNITFEQIDLSEIADGTYTGECNVDFIYAKVDVTVQDKKITAIEILEHKHERGSAAEPIVDKIVEEQNINVDAISGATNSSLVLKKAVENALT